MTKTTKAILLSALVFPGCGHFFLKRQIMAWCLVTLSILCLYFLCSNALDVANQISDKILRGEIPLDVGKISDAITAGLTGSVSRQITISTWVLVSCWFIGIVDIYRVANKSIET